MTNAALLGVASVVVPFAIGAALEMVVRRASGRHFRGVVPTLLALVLPVVGAVACIVPHPIVGLWDAAVEGALFGLGFVAAAHGAFAGDRLASLAAGGALGLLLVEIGARLFLPPPPRFPTATGAHFFLADAIRASRQHQGWDFRSREIACTVVYGERYRGMLDLTDEAEVRFPSRYAPRPSAARRELHVGDSLVFGLGVARDATFTAVLEAMDPATEHVNAGIPGLAPDAYLAVLEAWMARQRFDAVTMYVFEGNDVRDLDGPYPCCGFAPLLAYEDATARLRCAAPTPFDVAAPGFEWLAYNSPPPYVVRTLVDSSAAAAQVAAALVDMGQRYSMTSTASEDERRRHLAAILRTARDELARRGTTFSVVVFPSHPEAGGESPREHRELIELVTELGIPVQDATNVLRDALAGGRDIFLRPFDPHFNAAGHRLVADWIRASRAGRNDGAGR